jgi:hypothetical protein
VDSDGREFINVQFNLQNGAASLAVRLAPIIPPMCPAILLGSLVASGELEKAFLLAPKKQLPRENLLRIIADGIVAETLALLCHLCQWKQPPPPPSWRCNPSAAQL